MASGAPFARRVPELWGESLPGLLVEQARAVLSKADAEQARHPAWPVTALPRALAEAFGLGQAAGAGLTLACLCFYAAADVVDDAADGDLGLNPAWAPGWTAAEAVNAGHALLFTSAELLASLPGVPPEARAELAADWARAGRCLAAGQAGDLGARAASEADALAVAEAKTGASLGAFAAWPALAALAAPEAVSAWRAWGEAVGTWVQVFSDVAAYGALRPHPDLREIKRTLPLVVALGWDPALASWLAPLRAPLGPDDQRELAARVAACGATAYAALRVQSLRASAEAALTAAIAAWPAPLQASGLTTLMAALPRDPLAAQGAAV